MRGVKVRNKYMGEISVIIPTRNRLVRLLKTLNGLFSQNQIVDQVIVVDASDNHEQIAESLNANAVAFRGRVQLLKADIRGAAIQRNLGISHAKGEYILFLDDDIDFLESKCIHELIEFLHRNRDYAGASVVIQNQFPEKMGRATKFALNLINGVPFSKKSYGGTLVGPALNFLPTTDLLKDAELEVEWLNTTCTLYRKESLPVPAFDSIFTGYSLMEDVSLSVRVSRRGRLAVLRDAKIFHDSQPGDHKSNHRDLAKMALVNRDYIARRLMGRKRISYWWSLFIWELFQVCAMLVSSQQRRFLLIELRGKIDALWQIIRA